MEERRRRRCHGGEAVRCCGVPYGQPPTELAYTEINIAKGRDLKADLPLLNSEDGGVMGLVSVTLKAAASIRPFLDVRRQSARGVRDPVVVDLIAHVSTIAPMTPSRNRANSG